MTAARILPDFVFDQLLGAYADAEDEGRALSTAEIQAIAGWDNKIAARVREALKAAGLLTVLQPPGNSRPAKCQLTPAAWSQLGRQPKASLARTRTCLRCRTPFLSRGSGHRICNTCKSSDDWQSASLADTHVRGASGGGPRA